MSVYRTIGLLVSLSNARFISWMKPRFQGNGRLDTPLYLYFVQRVIIKIVVVVVFVLGFYVPPTVKDIT